MARSTTPTLIALALLLVPGCGEMTTTCRQELACANQEGLITTCCEDDPQITVLPAACVDDALANREACEAAGQAWVEERHIPTTRCWYEAPDGVVFECDPIEDEASAGGYCVEAVDALVDHCSD